MKGLQYQEIDGAARLQRLGANSRLADTLGGPLWRAIIAAWPSNVPNTSSIVCANFLENKCQLIIFRDIAALL